MSYTVYILLALGAVAYGQVPRPCFTPKVWESRVIEFDPTKKFEVRARVSIDSYDKRVRIVDEVNLHDKKDYYDVLYLHNVGIEYRLDLKTKKCERRPISKEWRDIHIPFNATFYGEFYLGGVLLVQNWGGDYEDGRYNLQWTLSGCIPISEEYYSTRTGFVSTTYFDTTTGIHDPNVFIPPKECNQNYRVHP